MNKIGIILIVLLGLLLRLVAIDKLEGLWNDEYVSYMIAATPFADGFWHAVKSQCHMPLYYLYLKITMLLFGSSDVILRLSSVITGMLSIIAMYFVQFFFNLLFSRSKIVLNTIFIFNTDIIICHQIS